MVGGGKTDSAKSARHHRRLFSRLLGMLADEGLIAKSGELWTVSREWSPIDPREVCAQMRAAFPQLTEQLAFIERCGLGLADVLTGECNPLELLFPNGSSAQAEHIYRDSPLARSFNTLLARTVADLASRIPAGGKVRVLEIGAGTGGSSSFVLPALPSDRTEYVFTDVSKMFLSRAEPQFGRYPFVRYATLNIENDPASQGFDTGRFDIVIAANVIHATRDLATALTHIKQLLAPGGVVLLLEATEAQRWIELTFGLTEGWFRFTDTELRSSHPLLSRSEWLALLRREGFEDYAAIPGAAIAPEQTLLIARTARQAKDRAVERDWIFLADANGVAAAAVALLRERGERATCLPIMSADEERRGLQRAMAEARGETTIVHLRSLDASGPHDAVAQAASQATLELCRAVSGDRTSSKPRIWLATRGAQPVDASGVAAPGQAPVWGLGRVLGLEQPDVWGGLIDLDPAAGAADQARDLVAIIAHAGDDDQIAVRNRAWFVPRIVRAAPIERRELRLDPQASYLVTGGLGRLGLNVGRWLGDRGARTIALLGRRGLPDRSAWKTPFADQEIERQVIGIRRIEETGARVVILTGDVADSASMRKVLADLDGVAPIKGIVHAATDLSIVPLAGMSDEQLATMLRPKVAGTSVLHELTRDRALDFFVLFSSTTALWGVSGMAHYAAANQFLDAFAHARRQQNLPATVINWGTWDELRVSRSEDRQRIAEAGLNGMSSERALDVLGALISGDATAKTVASIDWTRLKTVYEARRRRPLFDRIELGPSPKTSTSEGPSVSLAAVLEGAPEDRHERILAHVRDEAVRVLRLGSKRPVDPQQGLFEMGMDSLMSLELKSRLETFVGQTLPSTLTFNYPSIAALTTFIESLVPGEAPVRKRAPVGRAPESKTAPKPAERPLRNMSEDALAQLLADRLQKIR